MKLLTTCVSNLWYAPSDRLGAPYRVMDGVLSGNLPQDAVFKKMRMYAID